MKMYVVDEVDFGVVGVFSCKENAENFVLDLVHENKEEDDFEIQEFHLDNRAD